LVLPYLGPLPKVIRLLALLYTEAEDLLPLKEEAPTHLVPIKGQVHNTPWQELTLHPHYRCHTWPLSTFRISPNSLMILYCMRPHVLQCQPNFLQTKLPSDIAKFEGKAGDDPANHVMTFHLWCSSNSIMEDSARLRLFQRTLTGPSAKWYVEEKSGSHSTFESLAKAFLTFFQLPIRHDNGLELLSNFKQSSATHIADHIHEWRR
jgi:hypothetical protein